MGGDLTLTNMWRFLVFKACNEDWSGGRVWRRSLSISLQTLSSLVDGVGVAVRGGGGGGGPCVEREGGMEGK